MAAEKTNLKSDEMEIDLPRIARAVWRRLWLLMLAGMVGAAVAAGGVRLLTTPQYTSDVLLYITGSEGGASISSSGLAAARELVDSCRVLLYTRETLDEVIVLAELDGTYEQLRAQITLEAVDDTELFSVSVCGSDPQQTLRIARAIGEVLPRRVDAVLEGVTLRIADSAVFPGIPDEPGYKMAAIAGFLGGFGLAFVWIAAGVVFDPVIRTKAEIARACAYPILTVETVSGNLVTKLLAICGEGCATIGVTAVGGKAQTGDEAAEFAAHLAMRKASLALKSLPPIHQDNVLAGALETDGLLLVVRAGECTRADLAEAIADLECVRANILAIVFRDKTKSRR